MNSLLLNDAHLLICPACDGNLDANYGSFVCASCRRRFLCDGEIPLLFYPNEWGDSKTDVTNAIKSFYEETPFPNYEDTESCWSLRQKAENGIFVRLLDEQIPYSARILEVGCGTGQLSNFLGMPSGRTVYGTDICLNSLRLGNEFREKNQIEKVAFLQMNLFKPVFRSETFDFVICNGVLHHTSDPFLGFVSISKLVKKGGFIIVGLYHKVGRISTDVRRLIFRFSSNYFRLLDSRLRDKNLNKVRKHTWFMDQYKNPHESKHTIREVLNWFDQSGFIFVNSIPHATAFNPFSGDEKLFEVHPLGTTFDHFLVQLGMLVNRAKEGGFFIMIGRKRL